MQNPQDTNQLSFYDGVGKDPTQDKLFVQAGTSLTTPARINTAWQEFTPRDASHCLAHREKSILNSFAPSAGSQTGIAGTPTGWDPSSILPAAAGSE